jgi:hypothetical protein
VGRRSENLNEWGALRRHLDQETKRLYDFKASETADADIIRRAALLPDHHILTQNDADVVSHVLGGQNFSYSYKEDGSPVTWGAFGESFTTIGELRRLAMDHPTEDAHPAGDVEAETVGLDLFGNMLDTIAFLRVRLRALADVCIERGIISGPELLGKYNEYHERSYQAYRDLMLLRPDIFVQRFSEWLQTERDYRDKLAGEVTAQQ